MKKILCMVVCVLMAISMFAFAGCDTFYQGDQLANEKKQEVLEYFNNFDYSKMSNYRLDTTISATFANDSQKNTKFTGYAIINELDENTLEFYELSYKSSEFNFKLKVWCDGANCFFEENFVNSDGETVRNKFYHSVEMDGYSLNMQVVRQYFKTLDIEDFCYYMTICDLYGKDNNYYLSTEWDVAPTTLHVVLSPDSFRTKSEWLAQTETDQYLFRTTMQKTLQKVNVPNVEGMQEGYLSSEILDVLF